ncbi:putative exported protein [Serratia fonticola AU-P3(3)]|nr:putative exported protein [Serratia fonticola AU-P3(3)]
MKLLPCIAAALIATASFSTLAATMGAKQVDSAQASSMQSIGVVSVSGISGSPDDAIHALKQKATEDGATHYRIIGLDNPGDSSVWRGTAEVYR